MVGNPSVSQELFLDLPDPDSKSPDDSDADEETHEDFSNLSLVRREEALPEPDPTTGELVDPKTGRNSLVNDYFGVEIPVEERECIFGLHKKIRIAKAQIAELKKSRNIKSEDFTQDVEPPCLASGPTEETGAETSKGRAEEIRRRIQELQVSIAKREPFLD